MSRKVSYIFCKLKDYLLTKFACLRQPLAPTAQAKLVVIYSLVRKILKNTIVELAGERRSVCLVYSI